MRLNNRLLRHFLECVAIATVLFFPAGCDLESLMSALPDNGSLGLSTDQDPDGSQDDAGGDHWGDDGDQVVDDGDGTEDDGTDDSAGDDGEGDDVDDNAGDEPGGDAGEDEPGDDDEPDAGDGDEPGDDEPGDDEPGDDDPDDDEPGDDEPDDEEPGDDEDDDPQVPSNEYCDPVSDWSENWVSFEEQVLELVNQNRAAGADCGANGVFAATGPLSMAPALRCAARAHSMDMNVRDFFSHFNPDGDGPGQRLGYAGYNGGAWGENIAWGYGSPSAVVAGWMESDGHCANIMRPQYTLIGVGFYEGNYWTQTFGND